MPIASQYAVLSKDKKSIILPDDVQNWVKGVDRFIVVMENDGLMLKKARSHLNLDDVVTREESPLSENELNKLIHEIRK
ncbi:MAG: hypothetical protein JW927_10305 [Deltaproteobacteria bacterium]|nr:hypothetical protein [Deltaproteobacteria bacterium]